MQSVIGGRAKRVARTLGNEPPYRPRTMTTGAEPFGPGGGGAERDRTAGLVIANDALSQLSYSPEATGSRHWGAARDGGNAKGGRGSQAGPAGAAGFFAGRFWPNVRPDSEGSPMFLDAVFFLADAVLNLLWWAVMLAVIVQMLIQFGVLDTRNRVVWTVADFLYRVTEPLFSRLRRVLPNFGPVDLSPLAVLLLISAGQIVLGAARRSLLLNGLYF